MNGRGPIPAAFDNPPHCAERPGGERNPLQSDSPFREILENAPFGVCVTALDTRFLFANQSLCRMLGYSAQELLGTSCTQLSHPDDLVQLLEASEQLMKEPGSCLELEKRFIHRGGAVVWVRMRMSLARDSSGNPLNFVVYIEDITESERANKELHDRAEQFRIIADDCPSIIWAYGVNGDMQFFNKACRQFWGMDSEELDSGRWKQLVHPDDWPMFAATFEHALRERAPFRIEARLRRGDGEWRLLGSSCVPRFSSAGEYMGHVGLSADITERVQADRARQFELSLIQSIHAETLEGILVVDRAGLVVSYNKRFLDIWRLDAATAQDTQAHSFIGSEDRILMSSVLECLQDPDSFVKRVQELYSDPDASDHCEIELKDGRSLQRHSTGLKNPEGAFLGRVWFFRDITAHKEAEVSLRNANALADEANRRLLSERETLNNERRMLRALFDNIPDFMYVKDAESRFLVANSHLAHAVGVETPEMVLGKTDFDFYPHEQAMGFFQDEQNVIRSGQPLYNREEKGVDSTGREINVLTTKVPVRDSAGRVIGIAGVGHDITARKKMEIALREAERKYRGIFDNAVIGIFQSAPDGRILGVNQALASIYGYVSPQEMIESVHDLSRQVYVDPKRRNEFKVQLEQAGGVTNFECENYRKDGSKFWLSMSAVAICENGAVARYEGMCEDITTRKEMEIALREAERRYRGIFDNAIIGIYQSTPGGRILSANHAMALIFGYDSPEDMISSIGDISHQVYVHPRRREEFARSMDELGAVQSFECEVFRKDGSKIWLSIGARAVSENGAVVRYEGMCEDITERKLLHGQLLQAQKLESVGQLAAGIAHEINTPTQYIGDNVRFLKDAFQDLSGLLKNYERLLPAAKDNPLSCQAVREVEAAAERADAGYLMEEIPKAIDQTLEGVTRVATIVGAMKEFSHPGSKEKTPLDLNRAIGSAITVSRNEWKYVSDMETDFDPSLPRISCLEGEFNQVILNLIVNAAHAIGDVVKKGDAKKGRIKVQTRSCPGWAEIRIQDTGTGIPEKVRTRVFDPFFTTKEVGKGTGQGLAIARSVIVDKHGGSIHFETEEAKGTTFIIRLPYDGKALAAKLVAA